MASGAVGPGPFGDCVDQGVFLIVCAAVGYICFKWGFNEGVIVTADTIADEEDKRAK